jgi:hypothetical protein
MMQIFKLSIRPGVRGWSVSGVYQSQPGAPVVVDAPLTLDLSQLRAEITPLAYGQLLGEAVFASIELQNAFARARSLAGRRLHLLLEVGDDTLRALHWERLAVPLGGGRWAMAALDQRLCFALYVPSAVDRALPRLNRAKAHTLVVVANPAGLEQFDLKPFDAAAIADRLRRALGRQRSTLLADLPDAAGGPTLAQIGQQLTDRPCAVLHIVCHGRLSSAGEPVLYLANAQGQVDPIPISRLAAQLDLIGDSEHRPRMIYLMSCATSDPEAEAAFGGAAYYLVNQIGMPAVVAMTDQVSIATADELAHRFYRRLRRHGQPDRALVEARAGLTERRDVGVATLYSRLEGQVLLLPEPSPWPRILAIVASVLAGLAALLALLFVYAFEPTLELAVNALEWTLPAPPPQIPALPQLGYRQDDACAPAGALEQVLSDALAGQAHNLAAAGAASADTRLEVSWACSDLPAQPILVRVSVPGPPAQPIALLGEPHELVLQADMPQARAFTRAAAFYALGGYAAALRELGSYGQEPDAEHVDLAWLRANLLLRAGHWDKAQPLFARAAGAAAGALRPRLLANQAVASLYAREDDGFSANNPLDCAADGRAALEQAQASPALPGELQAELDLIAGWLLTLCPSSDQDLFEAAPLALTAAEEQLPLGHPLRPIADELRAENDRQQDLASDVLQGRVEEAALRALTADPTFARPYRTLGRLYADAGRLGEARDCFAAYARRAPLRFQRREGLRLGLRTWKWGEPLFAARPDLRACPG